MFNIQIRLDSTLFSLQMYKYKAMQYSLASNQKCNNSSAECAVSTGT